MKRFIAFMAAVFVAVSCCFPVLAAEELPDGVTVIDQEPEDIVEVYARDYLLPGEHWLCEEHLVPYDPAFPDGVCDRCLRDAAAVAPSVYDGGSLTLFSDSVSPFVDSGPTIEDNLFNPFGVVYRSANTSFTHATSSGSYYQFTNPYITASSTTHYLTFGFQQVQSISLSETSWIVFTLDILDASGNRVATSANIGGAAIVFAGSYYTGSAPTVVPRLVKAHGNDDQYYYALQVPSTYLNKSLSYFTIRLKSTSSYLKKSYTYRLGHFQLYSGGSADGPPAGWYSGDPNYNPGGGGGVDPPVVDPPTDIEIISGKFDEIFAWLQNIRDNLISGFTGLSDHIADGFSSLSSVVSSAKNAIVSGLSSVQSAVSTGFSNLQSYLESVFSNPSNDEVSGTAGEIADTIKQQEQIEQGMYDQFDSSVAQFNPSDYSLPADVGGSIGFILTCFTGLFDGLGSYKAVFLFVPAFSISLAFIGRMAQVTPGSFRAASRHQVFSNHADHVKRE